MKRMPAAAAVGALAILIGLAVTLVTGRDPGASSSVNSGSSSEAKSLDSESAEVESFSSEVAGAGTVIRIAEPASATDFGVVEIVPSFVLDGVGADVDSIAFWEAPRVQDTLMFVTSKRTSEVEVWKFPFIGGEQSSLRHPTFEDSEVNGVVMDQSLGLLYVATREPTSTISVFQYPGGGFVAELNRGRLDMAEEPNLDIYHHPDGTRWLYVTTDDRIHILDLDSEELIGSFTIEDQEDVETVVADEYWERVLVPDEKENRGVFVFDPDGSQVRAGETSLIGQDYFDDDAEGILLFVSAGAGEVDDGRGFYVASDQREDITEFEFFDRETGSHLGTMRLSGVSNTDGVASTQQALPGFPLGLFAAIDDDGSVVGIGWDTVFAAAQGVLR